MYVVTGWWVWRGLRIVELSLFVGGSILWCMALHVANGGDVMDLGKHEGNIPTLIQAVLLKYITCTSLHMYSICFMDLSPILNVKGSQSWHTKENPPTVNTFFLERTEFLSESPTCHNCFNLPRHIVAPLSR